VRPGMRLLAQHLKGDEVPLKDARLYLPPFLLFLSLTFTFFLLFFPWELKGELNLFRKYMHWGTTMIR